MGLADEIGSASWLYREPIVPGCRMRKILDALDDEDRSALMGLLSDNRVSATGIVRLLNGWSPRLLASAADASEEEQREVQELAKLCANLKEGTVQRYRRNLHSRTKEA